jgi:hypothetical protein
MHRAFRFLLGLVSSLSMFTTAAFGRGLSEHTRQFGRSSGMLLIAIVASCLSPLTVPQGASGDTCPNASLRLGMSASLPDCRSYEMVTPSFMNGQIPFFEKGPDSSHVLFSTLGAPGEAADDPSASGTVYETVRKSSGWSATALSPPASLFGNADQLESPFLAVSPDFESTLFTEFPASENSSTEGFGIDPRLVVRRPSGALDEVGPMMSPAKVAAYMEKFGNVGQHGSEGLSQAIFPQGASPDLSHIVFATANKGSDPEAIGWHWPGDPTFQQSSSLYEWVGTGHTGRGADVPALVGVNDEGHLISQCGTVLGGAGGSESGSLDTQHAISADGATVFFTAAGPNQAASGCPGPMPPAAELFARVAGSHTIAISEPTTSGPGADCSACNTASPEDAIFQGAAEDGSRVLFLTNQGLLPGSEGQGLYGYNFHPDSEGRGADDKLTRLATNVLGVARVSEDAAHVYFVSTSVLTSVANGQGQLAQAGANNLYVYEPTASGPGRWTIAYIASLSNRDEADWRRDNNRPVEASPDGRFLLFPSTNNLTPDASGSGRQLYRYDSQTGELTRVTVGEGGFNDNGNAIVESEGVLNGYTSRSQSRPVKRSMSDDGSYVFFQTPTALTPGALDNVCAFEEAGVCKWRAGNIYEYHLGHVSLITDGQDHHSVMGGGGVGLLSTTASGNDVFFTTVNPLVGQDTNTQQDIYDARIGGGFPPPTVVEACSGEACQGIAGDLPPASLPASASFVGPPTPSPAPAARSVAAPRKGRLARALAACARKPRPSRRACVRRARHRYGGRPAIVHRRRAGRAR